MTRPEPGAAIGEVRITVDLPAHVHQRLLATADNIAHALGVPQLTLDQLARAILSEAAAGPSLMTQCMPAIRQELAPGD
jgi:hypothetical protein